MVPWVPWSPYHAHGNLRVRSKGPTPPPQEIRPYYKAVKAKRANDPGVKWWYWHQAPLDSHDIKPKSLPICTSQVVELCDPKRHLETLEFCLVYTHTIHVSYIYLYIWLFLMVKYGKCREIYQSHGCVMGSVICWTHHFFLTKISHRFPTQKFIMELINLNKKYHKKKNNIQTLPKAPKTNRGDRTHHEDSSKGCPNPPPFK